MQLYSLVFVVSCCSISAMDLLTTDRKDCSVSLVQAFQWGRMTIVHEKNIPQSLIIFPSLRSEAEWYQLSFSQSDNILRKMRIWLTEDVAASVYLNSPGDDALKDVLHAYKNFCLCDDLPKSCDDVLSCADELKNIVQNSQEQEFGIPLNVLQHNIQVMNAIILQCTKEVAQQDVQAESISEIANEVLRKKMATLKFNRLMVREALKSDNPQNLERALMYPLQLLHMFLPA